MMRTRFLLAAALLLSAAPARAEHTRVTNPTALSVELLGRGLTFAAQFDEVINDDFAAGAGIGSTRLNDSRGQSASQSATMIPIYVMYYFTRDHGSFFADGGATLVANYGDAKGLTSGAGAVTFGEGAIQPHVGLGFEERRDSGFLFRLAAYGIFGKEFAPWMGFTFGFAF